MRDKLAEIVDSHLTSTYLGNTCSLDTADEIIKALPGMVRPLVWYEEVGGVYAAETSFGSYNFSIRNQHIDEGFMLFIGDQEISSENYTITDDAKAAAQADYARRIMEAFGL